jgi:FG-GAP-like repeat/FG-GAP repeat
VSVGDFDGDGKPDLVARDSAGTLQLYPGNGGTGLGSPVQLGALNQFAGMTAIQGATDFTGSGHVGLLARDSAGVLWYYPGTGTGAGVGLGSPITVATGFGSMTAIVGVGDFTGDGHADILARDSSGALWDYPGTGTGTLGARVSLSTGWGPYVLASAGDLNGDGFQDMLAFDPSTGTLRLYTGNGAGGWIAGSVLTPTFSGDTIAGSGATIAAITG